MEGVRGAAALSQQGTVVDHRQEESLEALVSHVLDRGRTGRMTTITTTATTIIAITTFIATTTDSHGALPPLLGVVAVGT